MGALSHAAREGGGARVMLVEDSAVVRGMVRQWLEKMPGIESVVSAENGQAALAMVGRAQPDLIVLDIEMPVMDGITALPGLLRAAPKAKVLIASTLSQRNAEISLRALQLGATDYLEKPSFAREGNAARAAFQAELMRKVGGLLPQLAIAQPRMTAFANDAGSPIPALHKPGHMPPRALAIGSSTGGPAALARVFADGAGWMKRWPVFVVQHMPPTFTTLLGDKLAKLAGLEGGEAREGEPVRPGRLYLAPGRKHMRVALAGGEPVIALGDDAPVNHCRPAVDPLFRSLAETYRGAVLGAVLTGMGTDGAEGARAIVAAGGTVIAQDEASSVVWGMPGAVALAGLAAALVPLDKVAQVLDGYLHPRRVS